MYWGLCTGFCIGKCIAGWLLAAFALTCFLFLSFISFHRISFNFIPYLLSCSFRRWNGSVFGGGPMEKGIKGRIKKEGIREEGRREGIRDQRVNQLASNVSSCFTLGAPVISSLIGYHRKFRLRNFLYTRHIAQSSNRSRQVIGILK